MPGLAANLDRVESYRFSWTVAGSVNGASGQPASTGSLSTTGIVVNSPARALEIRTSLVSYIELGGRTWQSAESGGWYPAPASTDLSEYLPTAGYARWFDANADQFEQAGEESRNGIPCLHYMGSLSLAALYPQSAGSLHAELWVARDGGYPVSGVYAFGSSTSSGAPGFGFSFDITNVGDPANTITAPPGPSAAPS